MNGKTKKLTTIALLSAISYVVMMFGRIPVVLFLKYDPKDVIITIGGFIFGPLIAALISTVVSLVEMFTVSDTGFIGLVMNILSTCSFACVASYFYRKNSSTKNVALGLALGTLVMTAVMLLWNYFITPIYMQMPREAVVKLLIPAFLPFNLIKGSLNLAITLLIYKPIINGFKKSNIISSSEMENEPKKNYIGLIIVSALILITCIFYILVLQGKI